MRAHDGTVWTLGALLERQARVNGDKTLIKTREGSLSFAECDREATRVAHGLHGLGVARGDVVLSMLPNSLEFVTTWFGAGRLGAMLASVNTSFRGPGLSRMINLTEGAVLVVAEEFLDGLAFVADDLTHVRTLVVLGDAEAARTRFPRWSVTAWDDVLGAAEPAPPRAAWREVTEADSFTLLFTSGTTGQSKACELTHYACLRQADLFATGMTLRSDDVLYCPFPIFHEDAPLWTVLPALLLGATAALSRRFTVSGFWDEIREFDATVFDFMGATLTMLWKQPPRPDDADNPARLAWGIPMPEFADAFRERFGLDAILDAYGLTEAGVCVFNDPERPAPRGSCGRAIPSYDVRIVDETGREVPPGTVGECVIRPLEPNLVMKGYYKMPEATLAMYSDLWLHTGDYASIDADGFFFFKSRKKDALRVRGENVSAFEVEEVVDSHDAVLESAAIAVPSDLTEDDVKVCVVLKPGAELTPEELVAYCRERMSKYMVPRYVEFLDELPKTPTEKVAKYVLERDGVTPSTWDRHTVEPPRRPAAGMTEGTRRDG